MKIINTSQTVKIPKNVKVHVKSRQVTITGPRGTLKRDFRHLNLDIFTIENGRKIKVELWFGTRKQIACVRTVCSHIQNLILGVTVGFEYKMKAVYAHFPISLNISDNKDEIEIRNFLGEKIVRRVKMLTDCNVDRTGNKDEIAVTGNDLELVAQSAANIQGSTKVKNKDIRKFLDGVYVSEKGNVKKYE